MLHHRKGSRPAPHPMRIFPGLNSLKYGFAALSHSWFWPSFFISNDSQGAASVSRRMLFVRERGLNYQYPALCVYQLRDRSLGVFSANDSLLCVHGSLQKATAPHKILNTKKICPACIPDSLCRRPMLRTQGWRFANKFCKSQKLQILYLWTFRKCGTLRICDFRTIYFQQLADLRFADPI